MSDNKRNFGVLLFESAIKELGEAITPYLRTGPIGKYIYCQKLEHLDGFTSLTIRPDQVDNRISTTMVIQIPSQFVKFVAFAEESDQKAIGYVQ